MNNISQVFLFGLLSVAAFALPLERNDLENNGKVYIFFCKSSNFWSLFNFKWKKFDFQTVGEYGEYFEGDMELTEKQVEAIFSPARNGIRDDWYRWPNKTVPYLLIDEHTKEQNDYIELALRKIESVSCVKFVRRTNEYDYVELTVSWFVVRG